MSDPIKQQIKDMIYYIYKGLIQKDNYEWRTLRSYISRIKDIELLNDTYIFIRSPNEYGDGVTGYDVSSGDAIMSLMVNEDDPPDNSGISGYSPWISSFRYKGEGLSEIIYSNRTEYFLNDKFIGSNDDNEIIKKIRSTTNRKIYKNKIFPSLYNIVKKVTAKPNLYFIEKEEFNSHFADLEQMIKTA